ncbi:hypothetical protein FRC11_006143 [Ceratobasidium sp. 423]|nr:hypothetical protein FRC11_006143 [Ceratobasidium sp. 423]
MNVSGSGSSSTQKGVQIPVASGTTNNVNQDPLNDAKELGAKALNTEPSELPPYMHEAPTVLDLTGSRIRLQVNRVVIKTHEYHISKFVYLGRLIRKARRMNPQTDTLTIAVTGDNKLVSDFLNTFKILNTSSIDKPGNFDTETLVSAARVSAKYNHPTLRAFCIERLEGLSLDSMERLRIARALDLKSWEERAYQELSGRRKMITKEEALDLGIDAYWQVASARETQQKRNPINHPVPIIDSPKEIQIQNTLQPHSGNKGESKGIPFYMYLLLAAFFYANFIVGP